MSNEQILRVPLKDIHVSAQPRTFFDEEALASLAASIKLHDVLQPLIVTRRGKELHLVDGERRYRAAGLAGCEDVPVIVREVADDADKTIVQLVANLQRVDLNPIEKAQTYAKLENEFGMTRSEIAGRVNESESTICRLMRLLDLPAEIQTKVQSSEITAAIAYELTHFEDEAQRNSLALEASNGNLRREDLQQLRRKALSKRSEPAIEADRSTLSLTRDCKVTIVASALDLERVRLVLEKLNARVRKALGQGISLGTFARMLKEESKQTHPAHTGGK